MIYLIPQQTICNVEFTINLTIIQYLYVISTDSLQTWYIVFTLLYMQVLNLKLSETPRNLQILQIKICNRNRLWHNYSSREAQELFQNFEILKPVWQNKTAAYYTTIKFNNLRYFRFFPRLRYDILFCHIKMQSCFSATTSFTGCLIAT